ncbi:MAG TPA: glycoside hydrolase family 6 protein [Oligoflexus sp.]|uniref:glycoside hydrolase family 6 protein n=1 Tax=Oligoflexus sp. TaxID=1971216 RepID=UPI002D306C5A|nr:glycoside hydrolase family 6 protein [Oligoflexus sp.]HYX37580.1 glycoside hydrolase family 6 protein [Oligoflexus sp.]
MKNRMSLALLIFTVSCVSTGRDTATLQRKNPLAGKRFHVDKASVAAREAEKLQVQDPGTAKTLRFLADQPSAIWFGGWSGPIQTAVEKAVQSAEAEGSQLVAVAYNVPHRDCGQHSSGGLEGGAYKKWIDDFAKGLGQHEAVIILEPDAIPLITCLNEATKKERWQLLNYALESFKTRSKALVYMDVGHGSWIPAGIMKERLNAIGIDQADGFSINTSNYQSTADSIAFGRKLQRIFPGKGLVIDTSRNGNGPSPDNAWCNPRGRAIGPMPQVVTDVPGVDAYLWTKKPGESDGACNGGPAAGEFWIDVAKELVDNAEVTAN